MHLQCCTYLLKRPRGEADPHNSNLCSSEVNCKCFEEGKALGPKTLCLRASAWSVWRQICSTCGWGVPDYTLCNLTQWTSWLHGPPICPQYVTPPYSLSTFCALKWSLILPLLESGPFGPGWS